MIPDSKCFVNSTTLFLHIYGMFRTQFFQSISHVHEIVGTGSVDGITQNDDNRRLCIDFIGDFGYGILVIVEIVGRNISTELTRPGPFK